VDVVDLVTRASAAASVGRVVRDGTEARNELALRQLADHARSVGWDAYLPAATTLREVEMTIRAWWRAMKTA
jgi:hypothetical protein